MLLNEVATRSVGLNVTPASSGIGLGNMGDMGDVTIGTMTLTNTQLLLIALAAYLLLKK